MRMQTNFPARKVSATAIGTAFITVVLWMLKTANPDLVIPEAVSAAITTMVVFAFGYFTPPGARDGVMETASLKQT
ncbi:hypothetical protein [Labrenzia sp. OB1]|uniref:hypothetical protein n=1 Tax=Labrenzia sp. OB1 TaxID=1561204 RepID=UPI0007B22275|nr:hypothetical protein [Labrenzia sp. OB1]KZM52011.1 hypothetical protein OA90_01655 [Labrenzia sp. OB1]